VVVTATPPAVVVTCGDDCVTPQTNCVVGMTALAEAEATCDDDGATSLTNCVVVLYVAAVVA